MSSTPSSNSVNAIRSLAASPANSAFLDVNGNGANGYRSVSNGFSRNVSHVSSETTAGPSSAPDRYSDLEVSPCHLSNNLNLSYKRTFAKLTERTNSQPLVHRRLSKGCTSSFVDCFAATIFSY